MPSNHADSMAGQEADSRVVNLSEETVFQHMGKKAACFTSSFLHIVFPVSVHRETWDRHLKRIECLPKRISPFTLLLNHNEISKVENLQYFAHLQQLSLSGNHIVDMKGISMAQDLKVLDLSNNSIVGIGDISTLRNLEWLNLSGNSIEEIENLDKNSNLYHLDLSDNSIAVISGLRTLKKLKTLLLHGNLISSLANMKEQLSSTVCTLSLADNEISDLNEMMYLSCLVNLEQLSLVNNPCVLTSSSWRLEINYRPYLVYCCPNLRNLDGSLVTNQERLVARLLNQALHQIGHPSPGQHIQLVSILHHICTEPTSVSQTSPEDASDDQDGNTLLESESFYIPVPPSDVEQTQSDDPIMTEEEALRLLSLAATIIQAHVRGYLVRKNFDFCQYRRRKYAATRIQAAWKGNCARTRDIRVVNIRNELRVRRLISVINNLYSQLQRKHEEAVKSREQLKTAIKYLWCQIAEQKRVNQLQLHKQRVKAATTIQAWWRGYVSRKAFPCVHKKVDRDKVSILFGLCRNLQMQLDVISSQVNAIAKGDKQNKKFQRDDQTVSGQEQGLDLLADDMAPSTDGKMNHMNTSAADELNAKAKLQLGHTHKKTDTISDEILKLENVRVQSKSGNDSLEPEVNTMTPSTGDLINVTLPSPDHVDIEVNKPTSNIGLQEDNTDMTTSHVGRTDRDEKGEELPPPGPSKTSHTASDEEAGSNLTSGQESRSLDKEAPPPLDSELDRLEENMVSSEYPHSSAEESSGFQLTGETQKQQVYTDDNLHVSIPDILVSSPVPTDDESSNEGSVLEGDVEEVLMEAEQCSLDRQIITESQSDVASSWKSQSSKQQDIESRNTASDSSSVPTENVSDDSKLSHIAFSSTGGYVASSQASDRKHDEEETVAEPRRSAAQGSVPNLGERASNLLSQLRSEIASMKSARLSTVLPIVADEEDTTGREVKNNQDYANHQVNTATASLLSQERGAIKLAWQEHDPFQVTQDKHDTTEPALQEHDTSEPASEECDISEPTSEECDISEPASEECDIAERTLQECDTSEPPSPENDTTEPASQERDIYLTGSQERDAFHAYSQEHDMSQLGPTSTVKFQLPLFEDVDSTCTSFSLDDFISDPTTEEASNLSSDT